MKSLKLTLILLLVGFIAWRCTSEQEPLPNDCSLLELSLVQKTDANCGLADGSITVAANGFGGTVTYTINGGTAENTTGVFNNLGAGSYTVQATEDGCTTEIIVEILNADGVNATFTATDSDCGGTTGTITVAATGGATPYEYRIGNNAFQSSDRFNALAPGDYQVTVRDGSGCEVVLQARVDSDVVFDEINQIVQTNCAVSGCHNGTQAPDFRNAANIVSSANRIQIRTGARTMPPATSGRTLTDAEIQAIACWVNDGAPGN